MTDPTTLPMLALRRFLRRGAASASLGSAGAARVCEGAPADLTALIEAESGVLGRTLRRAIERSWLTLEMFFCQESLAATLGRESRRSLHAIFDNHAFDHLAAIPPADQQAIRRELHRARISGHLNPDDPDTEQVLRQLTDLAALTDERSAGRLEWSALWQMAGDLAREGYPALRTLIEARTGDGDSLLVGLVAAFLAVDHDAPEALAAGVESTLLPADNLFWLCNSVERLEVVLT